MNLIKTKSFRLAIFQKGDLNSKKLCLVLPGKLDTKDYPHMQSHVNYLAERGHLAISFDPPGTWESPGDIKLYSMTNYLSAINELIEFFGKKPTFVIGHSRGGSMAMLAGIKNPQVTHFASIMSYYSFVPSVNETYPNKDWQRTGYNVSKRDIPQKPGQFREFKLPYSFLEDQINYDMLDGLKKTKKPKLFILGKKDITVNPQLVKTAFDQAAEPKMLKELDSNHDYRKHDKLIRKVNDFIGDFLDTYDF